MLKFLIFFFLFQSIVNADTLLSCLGNEELKIHKKKVIGPIFRLNQHFVNKFASFSNIHIKKTHLLNICNDKSFSPSVALLKMILLKGIDLYIISKNEFQKAQDLATIESFITEIPHTFFSYLASLQNEASTPDCLPKRVKNMQYFTDNLFYLETHLSYKVLFKEHKKIKELFNSLKKLDQIWKECKKETSSKKTKS